MHQHGTHPGFHPQSINSPLTCSLVLGLVAAEGVGAGEAGCVVLGRSPASLSLWHLIYRTKAWSRCGVEPLKGMKSLQDSFPFLGKIPAS